MGRNGKAQGNIKAKDYFSNITLLGKYLEDFDLQTGPWTSIVESLNSPFFPPHIGAEPGRAKKKSLFSPLYGAGRKESSGTGLGGLELNAFPSQE